MSSPIALLGVFADAVILLALAAAVASRRISQLTRLVIATFAFACGWLVTVVLGAMRAADWTIFTGGAVIVVGIVVITATLQLWTQAGDGGERWQGPRGDQDGGGPRRRRPDAPQHGGGGSDPSWWPEFERQLASYAASVTEKEETAVLPAEPASLRHRAARRQQDSASTNQLRERRNADAHRKDDLAHRK